MSNSNVTIPPAESLFTNARIRIALIAGIVMVVLGVGCEAIGVHNTCVRAENGLEAQYQQNENNYANFFNKLKETSQVPSMYVNDLDRLYKTAISGRYGEGGSKAVMQFIQEKNPNLDSKLYVQIQRIIEAGHNSFEADQKMLLDQRRLYQDTLGVAPSSMFASWEGFPHVDLKKYDPVINDTTEQAFKTKKAGPIDLSAK